MYITVRKIFLISVFEYKIALVSLCSSAVNSERLLCIQKAGVKALWYTTYINLNITVSIFILFHFMKSLIIHYFG